MSKNIKITNNLEPYEAIEVYYFDFGLNVIPVDVNKAPIIKTWSKYTKEKVSEHTIARFRNKIKEKNLNIAIITKFNNLLVYDIDSKELYELFKEKFKETFGKEPNEVTWVAETGKGYHVYLRVKEIKKLQTNKTIWKDKENKEIKRIFGGYVLAPPSKHPSGKKYQWIHNDDVILPLEVTEEKVIELESKINPELWIKIKTKKEIKPINKEPRELTEEEIKKIIEILEENEWWREGQRQFVLMALTYILRVFGNIKLESVKKLYEKIRKELGDDPRDYSMRIRAIELTYEKNYDEIAYRTWLEEAGFTLDEIENFKWKILSVIGIKTFREYLRKYKAYTYVYKVRRGEPKKDKESGLLKQKITFYALEFQKNGIMDIEHVLIKFIDPETGEEIEDLRIYSKYVKRERITAKPIEFLGGFVTENGTYVAVKIKESNKEILIRGKIDYVLTELQEKAGVNRNHLEKLRELLTFLAKLENIEIYNTVGIYVKNNEFVYVGPGSEKEEYLFLSDQQAYEVYKNFSKGLMFENEYQRFLEAWLKYKEFLGSRTYYVVLGWSFVAPLFYSIRDIVDLRPLLVLVGKKKVGKTTLAKFISILTHGGSILSADTLKSPFRYMNYLGSGTISYLIDDADNLPKNVLEMLKVSATSEVEHSRGLTSLKLRKWEDKATLVFTSNTGKFLDELALLDRTIIIDQWENITPQKKLKFDKKIKPLIRRNKTFAPFVFKDIVEVVNNLGGLEFVKEFYENTLNDVLEIFKEDISRTPEKCAIIILGLKIAHEIFKMRLGYTFDFNEAKKLVIEFFKGEEKKFEEYIPARLQALLYELRELYMEENQSINVISKDGKDFLVLTTSVLEKIKKRNRNVDYKHLNEVQRDLASITDEDWVKKLRHKVNGKTMYCILIPLEFIEKILGESLDTEIEKESKEVKPEKTEEIKIVRTLKVEEPIQCSYCYELIYDTAIEYQDGSLKMYFHPKCYKLFKAILNQEKSQKEQNKTNEENNKNKKEEKRENIPEEYKDIIGNVEKASDSEIDF